MNLTQQITPQLRDFLNEIPHNIPRSQLGKHDVSDIAEILGTGANPRARLRQAERWFTQAGQRRGMLPRSVVGHDWLSFRRHPKTRGKLTICAGLSESGLEWERENGHPGVYVDAIGGTLMQAADRIVDIIQGLANIDSYLLNSWFQLRIVSNGRRRWNVEILYMSGMTGTGPTGKKESMPAGPVDDPELWGREEDEIEDE